MKQRITLLLMICVLGTTFAFAQRRDYQRGPRREYAQRNFSPEERAKRMTERMTYDYVLTEKQTEKVLKLNEEWVEKTTELSKKYNLRRGRDNDSNQVCYYDLSDSDRDVYQKERIKLIDKFDADLKKILTKEQYAKHEKRFDSRYNRGRGYYCCDGEGQYRGKGYGDGYHRGKDYRNKRQGRRW